MAKRGSNMGVGVGGSSILVIFILLCLTTFATLSMVSANADLRLTEKSADAVREFYAADAAAEQLLAAADKAAPGGVSAVAEAVPGAQVDQADGGALLVSYAVPVNESQELSVLLRIQPDGRCIREMWQVVPVGEWEPESGGFDLWDGGDAGFMLGLPE